MIKLAVTVVLVIAVTEGFVRSTDNEIVNDSPPAVSDTFSVNDFIKKVGFNQ